MTLDDHLHRLAGTYTAAPPWIKTVFGGLYAQLSPQVRFGRAYDDFRQTFGGLDSPTDYAEGRLRQTLTVALGQVPAFRAQRRLLSVLQAGAPAQEVLRQIPLTPKESIKANLRDYLADDQGRNRRLKMFTGGSTAQPMNFYLHRGVSRAKEWAAFHALGQRFGTEGDGVTLALRGRTVGSAGGGRVWVYEPIKRQVVASTDHLEPRFMPQYAQALRRWRPAYIHAFPSALYPLVTWLSEHADLALLDQVKGVLLTSESVSPGQLARFRAVFKCPVIVHYGHTERVLFAHTLADDARYHFWPRYGHLELVDSTGQPINRPGQVGEIVGTSFDNLVMPFVRYRTGDYAAWASDADSPIPGAKVVEGIEGRLQEFIVCRDRRVITVTALGAAHFEQLNRCLRIQYEQRELGQLLLRVVPLQPLDAAARDEIARAVMEKTQGGCRVRVEEVEAIDVTQRGKQRLLIQHLDVTPYLGAAAVAATGAVGSSREDPVRTPQWQADDHGRAVIPDGRRILMIGTDPAMRGGIAAVVTTLRQGGLFDQVPITYVATHVEGRVLRKQWKFLGAVGRTLVQLASGRIALMHAHVSSRGSFFRKSMLLGLARCFGVPTIFHLHSGGFDRFAEQGPGGGLLRWWIRHTLQASTQVVVLSESWANWIRKFAPASRVSVVPNPVIVPAEVRPRSPQPVAADRPGRVLFLGLIGAPKGCYDLLAAWAQFRADHPHWRLVVGGNGEVDKFLARASELGIKDDIDYLGWVSGEAKDRELGAADIFVLPSYREGMPVSVLEAMAHGAAVVVTPVGGVPDMMQADVHGLWVAPGDVPGLADRLGMLASDAELRRRLTRAARDHAVAGFSVESVVARLLGIYRKLAAPSSTR